jgi:hypothetical protein
VTEDFEHRNEQQRKPIAAEHVVELLRLAVLIEMRAEQLGKFPKRRMTARYLECELRPHKIARNMRVIENDGAQVMVSKRRFTIEHSGVISYAGPSRGSIGGLIAPLTTHVRRNGNTALAGLGSNLFNQLVRGTHIYDLSLSFVNQ